MIKILPATTLSDYKCISELAHTIWHEHYIKIITIEQIEYMLEKYNAVQRIEKHTQQGALFFLLTYDDVPVGYLAIKPETGFLYISKLYVLKAYRGLKIAKKTMLYVDAKAIEMGLQVVKLHVNKYNSNSLKAYEKMGYVNVESVITDIGSGFIMDDYLMEKKI